MATRAGQWARKMVLGAVLLLSSLLVITPFALAQDSEQSILRSQSVFGLPDVVPDELPGLPGIDGPGDLILAANSEHPSRHETGAAIRRPSSGLKRSVIDSIRQARGPPGATA